MLTTRRIFQTWWPLAASWLLMGIELPALSAFVARLPDPTVNLAAYGGVIFPLALIVESPVIMLLAASTALSKDWASYQLIWRFMMVTSAIMTAVHILVAFTPLYYVIVIDILGVPPEIVEPARVGLMIMTPWTWSIAYRRFHQGVLIRFGRSRMVGKGTLVRLGANLLVLSLGFWNGSIPGVVVATSAVISGVVSEAIYVGIVVKPVLNNQLRPAPPLPEPLTFRAFMNFYVPLALTSLLILLVQPINSAAISRMPSALASLAVWPVISGLVFMLRSPGIAYNEVVVALLDENRSSPKLKQFAGWLAVATTLITLVITATPLALFWFGKVSALTPGLALMARNAMWLALPLPALNAAQSWLQGVILFSKKTRGITESVGIYLLTSGIILILGIWSASFIGLYVSMIAFVSSMLTQTGWLWLRSAFTLRFLRQRDAVPLPVPAGTTAV